MTNKYPVEIDGVTGEVESLGVDKSGSRYRAKLDTIRDIKNEMSKVYREARSGKIDISDSTKLVYILNTIGKTIVDSELEQRIEALEKIK